MELRRIEIFVSLALLGGLAANGATVVFDMDQKWTGTAPAGPTPWLRAIILDDGPNQVKLTLQALNLVGGEFTTKWAFNLDPALQQNGTTTGFKASTFTLINSTIVSNWSYGLKRNDRDVLSSKNYDLSFSFQTSNGINRFTDNEELSVRIAMQGINANSFLFRNDSTNSYEYYSAAHIQGIAPCDYSAGIYANNFLIPPQETGVPEPGTYAMLGGGLGLIAIVRRRAAN